MLRAARARWRVLPSAMIALGGILAVISRSLHWATLTFPRITTTTATVPVGHAPLALFIGIVLIIRGLLGWFASELTAKRGSGWPSSRA